MEDFGFHLLDLVVGSTAGEHALFDRIGDPLHLRDQHHLGPHLGRDAVEQLLGAKRGRAPQESPEGKSAGQSGSDG